MPLCTHMLMPKFVDAGSRHSWNICRNWIGWWREVGGGWKEVGIPLCISLCFCTKRENFDSALSRLECRETFDSVLTCSRLECSGKLWFDICMSVLVTLFFQGIKGTVHMSIPWEGPFYRKPNFCAQEGNSVVSSFWPIFLSIMALTLILALTFEP